MTGAEVPPQPGVLDATVLSNFASIDQIGLLSSLAAICTVPVVADELRVGVETNPFLRPAVNALADDIPVVRISDTVANREAAVRNRLDPGEAQAFALADIHDGRLLTDDGDARRFAKDRGLSVVGSVGVLLAAIDTGRIDDGTANEWLTTWIDEYGYRAPYHDIREYR